MRPRSMTLTGRLMPPRRPRHLFVVSRVRHHGLGFRVQGLGFKVYVLCFMFLIMFYALCFMAQD